MQRYQYIPIDSILAKYHRDFRGVGITEDDASLEGAGLPHLKGQIQTKDELVMLDFLLETAHLIYNNQDMVRGVNWEIHTEITEE